MQNTRNYLRHSGLLLPLLKQILFERYFRCLGNPEGQSRGVQRTGWGGSNFLSWLDHTFDSNSAVSMSNNRKSKSQHTHTRLTALFPGLPGWAGTRTVKPIWILLKQETVSGSGISWAICKSASRSRQITMQAPHCSVFLPAGCPSCRPTNSVKALKAKSEQWTTT